MRRASARPRWGNLKRTEPFSDLYGSERGTPIDRFYIERFLVRHAGDIAGDVLEVQSTLYTSRLGANRVRTSTVVDIDGTNRNATIVADLSELDSLPSDRFDCFVCTQTLQYVADLDRAVANAAQAIRPGGVLLVTVPAICRVDTRLHEIDRRRFTEAGLREALARAFPDAELEVADAGNLIAAIAWLLGLAVEDLEPADLGLDDARFPIVVCARAVRPR